MFGTKTMTQPKQDPVRKEAEAEAKVEIEDLPLESEGAAKEGEVAPKDAENVKGGTWTNVGISSGCINPANPH